MKKLKISILGCYSACDNGDEKSFAFRLSRALDGYGIRAEIFARTGSVRSDTDNFRKLVDRQHQGKGKKILFTTENGITTATPYEYK